METGFLDRRLRLGRETYRYQVFVPQIWKPARRWPVITFLHGSGERGSDGLLQTAVGLPDAIRQRPDRVPAIVVLPQCRAERRWTEGPMQEMVLAALDAAVGEFHGDPLRLTLTGMSMGGYGCWSLAATDPRRFAALAPVCGGVLKPAAVADPAFSRLGTSAYREVAEQLARTPVWIVHGERDKAVPVAESRRMAGALAEAGGDVRYSELKGVGHDSWTHAYLESELVPWLLARRLRARLSAPPSPLRSPAPRRRR